MPPIQFGNPDTYCDDYSTGRRAYEELIPYVPQGSVIVDPFWNDGGAKRLMEDVFDDVLVHHTPGDAFTTPLPADCTLIITNPPFSMKERSLRWLLTLDKPFLCLLPFHATCTGWFRRVAQQDSMQLLFPQYKVSFKQGAREFNYYCVWYAHGMNLPRDVTLLRS